MVDGGWWIKFYSIQVTVSILKTFLNLPYSPFKRTTVRSPRGVEHQRDSRSAEQSEDVAMCHIFPVNGVS